MQTRLLLKRNLVHYWRTNLAVIAGVGIAVAVLAGALMVGDSVRASLRDLFLSRVGRTEYLIAGSTFFREALASDLNAEPRFDAAFDPACPMIVIRGLVKHEQSGRRASHVQVYGVDERFWKFHGVNVNPPGDREVLLSPALAAELGTGAGDSLLLRIEKPSAIPADSLHGRKEDLGRTIRLALREALAPSMLGEFSVSPQQGPVRAAFVSMRRLQRDLDQSNKVNTILLHRKNTITGESAAQQTAEEALSNRFALEDLGITLRVLPSQGCIAFESNTAIIDDTTARDAAAASTKLGFRQSGVLTYLANTIRSGEREIPYSLVTALDPAMVRGLPASFHFSEDGIVLNEWAANDLAAKPGDEITLDYYEWEDEGRLITKSARFKLDAITPLNQETADRNLAPDYPGITETNSLSDWDPPFPIDLKRVRPRDEDYWRQYRTTPKAFLPLARGQQLWQSRHGRLTSIRLFPSITGHLETSLQSGLQNYKQELRSDINPVQAGLAVRSVLLGGLQASQGATDFGEYFVYFSFFLVVSALLLASLFFKLGIEQRVREIGLLRAVGFPASRIRRLFLIEGIIISISGSIIGAIGAVAYGALLVTGLKTWWIGAVGTNALSLHVAPASLVYGAAGGVLAAVVCIVVTLRTLAKASPRSLLAGDLETESESGGIKRTSSKRAKTARLQVVGALLAAAALLLVVLAFIKIIGQTAGFFGAGSLLLGALLCWQAVLLRRGGSFQVRGSGLLAVARVGFRNAAHRPGRSLLCIALIASAVFIVVAIDAFRADTDTDLLNKKSGSGGFPLLADSMLPIYHDPNTAEGRDALNLSSRKDLSLDTVKFSSFRVREGDDASCLNLYQPRTPRILAPSAEFIKSGRFSFQDSAARTAEEKGNPWLLLDQKLDEGVIPAVTDANSMTYVLHRKLGDTLDLDLNGKSAKVRLVGALSDSIFQSELLISEENFLALFPASGGFAFFLIDAPPEQVAQTGEALEEQLADFGFDATSAGDRLAAFHRVENTYLSTFQALGGLGLLLGTLGLAAVLLRNVLERRKELAVLRAMGYDFGHFRILVLSENAFLVVSGLITGALCAVIAIAPAVFSRGGHFSAFSLGLLAIAVLGAGLAASVLATRAAIRSPLLSALRAE